MSPPAADTAPSTGRAVGLAVGASLLWAGAIVLVKIGLEDIPPLTFASLRYVVGAATLLAWRLARAGRSRPVIGRETASWLVGLGLLLYAFVPAAQFLALDRLEAVTFNFVFQAGIPLVLAGAAGFILREPTSWWEWVGVAIVVVGIYVFYPALPDSSALFGIALAAAAAIGIGGSNLIQRQVMRGGTVTALDATLLPMGLGSLALFAYALIIEGSPGMGAAQVALILVLGVVNTAIAFTMWHHAMRTLKALHAGIIASAQIVEVPLLAWLIIDESMSSARVVGSAIVLGGILLVHYSKAAAARTERQPGLATERAG